VTHQEKRAWIMLVASLVSYTWYAVTVIGRTGGRPLPETSYAATLLWAVGASIVGSIVADIAIGIVNRQDRETDVRDREIGRLGEYVGRSFVIIGAVAGMLMAMADWDRFWIANVIYLGFTLSAVLGSIAKIAMYRGGLPRW